MTTPPGSDPSDHDPSGQSGQPGQPGAGQPGAQHPGAQPPPPPSPYGGGYGGPPPYGPGGYPGPQPVKHQGTTVSLVLGIVGLVLCQVISPFAWWYGKKTMNEIDAQPGAYMGYGEAKAGWICGIIGTALLALSVVVFVVVIIVTIATAPTSSELSLT